MSGAEGGTCTLTIYWEFTFPPLHIPDGMPPQEAAAAIQAFVGDTASATAAPGRQGAGPCILVKAAEGADGRMVMPTGMRCAKPVLEWAWRVELPDGGTLSPQDTAAWTVADLNASGGRVVMEAPLEWAGPPPALF